MTDDVAFTLGLAAVVCAAIISWAAVRITRVITDNWKTEAEEKDT